MVLTTWKLHIVSTVVILLHRLLLTLHHTMNLLRGRIVRELSEAKLRLCNKRHFSDHRELLLLHLISVLLLADLLIGCFLLSLCLAHLELLLVLLAEHLLLVGLLLLLFDTLGSRLPRC